METEIHSKTAKKEKVKLSQQQALEAYGVVRC
jgi:hypothetical protein